MSSQVQGSLPLRSSPYYQLDQEGCEKVGQLAQKWKLNPLDLRTAKIPSEWSAAQQAAAKEELVLHWRYALSGRESFKVARDEMSKVSYEALQTAVAASPAIKSLTVKSRDANAVKGFRSRRRLSIRFELEKEPSLEDLKQVGRFALNMRSKEESEVLLTSPRGQSPTLASPKVAARLTEPSYQNECYPSHNTGRRSSKPELTRRASAPPEVDMTKSK